MQIGLKEELIKLIQDIPDDFVYEAIEIIRQISRREEAWDEFLVSSQKSGVTRPTPAPKSLENMKVPGAIFGFPPNY